MTTTYAPTSDLTLTFIGSLEFSPATIILAAGQTSVTVRALPLAVGNGKFRVVYSGDDAGSYQTTSDWSVTVAKCMLGN